jgi:hypothetical protein
MVLRYIKMSILSVYGGWAYFTLTQVKVFGESIFAHAAKATGEASSENINENSSIWTNDPLLFFSNNDTFQY